MGSIGVGLQHVVSRGVVPAQARGAERHNVHPLMLMLMLIMSLMLSVVLVCSGIDQLGERFYAVQARTIQTTSTSTTSSRGGR